MEQLSVPHSYGNCYISEKNGKLNREITIFYPSTEIVDDQNPPIAEMALNIALMPYEKSFFNDLKLIDRNLENAQSSQIMSKIYFDQIDKTNIIEISYYDDDYSVSKKALNLLMAKVIELDFKIHEDKIKRNKELISEIPAMLETRYKNKNPTNKIQQEIEDLKRSQQKMEKNQIYLESIEQYLSQLSARSPTSSINYEIVEFADSSCPIIGHFNSSSIYLYWHSHWVYFRYSILGRYI